MSGPRSNRVMVRQKRLAWPLWNSRIVYIWTYDSEKLLVFPKASQIRRPRGIHLASKGILRLTSISNTSPCLPNGIRVAQASQILSRQNETWHTLHTATLAKEFTWLPNGKHCVLHKGMRSLFNDAKGLGHRNISNCRNFAKGKLFFSAPTCHKSLQIDASSCLLRETTGTVCRHCFRYADSVSDIL